MNYQRRLILENIVNCRDLGGFPTKYGITKFGRFIRAGAVKRPTDNDIEQFRQYGIKTVIDLRGDYETQTYPTNFERIGDIDVYHISLYELNVAVGENADFSLDSVYRFIIDNHTQNIAKVLKTIANAPEGAVLYHCFFGKDRTGILSMLLLSVAGAYQEDIIADYQLTYTYIRPYIETHADELWSQEPSAHYSLPETIRSLMEYINKKYGSVLDYISFCGVTNDEIEKIRTRFF